MARRLWPTGLYSLCSPSQPLDRDLGRKLWSDAGYAAEELVAELGAAFVLADLDLTPQVRPEHAAYIQSWLKVLKDDKRNIHRRLPRAAGSGLSSPGSGRSAPDSARRTSPSID